MNVVERGDSRGVTDPGSQVMLNRAWGAVAAREGYDVGVMPVFAVGHSLGCKLQLLASFGAVDVEARESEEEAAAHAVRATRTRAGHLLVAFNNATAADSVRLLEKFARELLKKRARSAAGGEGKGKAADDAFDGFMRNLPALTALAERAAAAAGLTFVPSPEETLEGTRRRFDSPKVRLVRFRDDDLDQNAELEAALRKRFEMTSRGPAPLSVSELPGNHLTPVCFKLDRATLSPPFGDLGKKFLSMGDEEAVKRLAEESVKFLRGGA